jgi:hypothetical protein
MIVFALTAALLAGQTATPRVVEISPVTPSSAANPGALAERPREGERLVCRTESVVGSNRRQRVCMSAEQRDRIRQESQDFQKSMNQPFEPGAADRGGGG